MIAKVAKYYIHDLVYQHGIEKRYGITKTSGSNFNMHTLLGYDNY